MCILVSWILYVHMCVRGGAYRGQETRKESDVVAHTLNPQPQEEDRYVILV